MAKCLKEYIIRRKMKGRCYIAIRDKHLIILSPNENLLNELFNLICELGLKDKSEAARLEHYIYSFSRIPDEIKLIAYKALSKSLEHHIFESLYNKNWIILSGNRAYIDNEKLVIDLVSPLANYVKLYRGIQLVTLPLILYDVLGSKYLCVGLCIDPVVIIEPLKSLNDILNEGMEYKENKITRRVVTTSDLYDYRIVRYETWDIIELNREEGKVKVVKMFKEKGKEWKPKIEEFSLNEVYPLRRPEIIDRLVCSKYKLTKRLTMIVKRETFQITEGGKKDLQASLRRYNVTTMFSTIISNVVSENKYFRELQVMLEKEPLKISTSW